MRIGTNVIYSAVHLVEVLHSQPRRHQDYRTRGDRTQRRNKAFQKVQMDMVNAFTSWNASGRRRGLWTPRVEVMCDRSREVRVVDVFSELASNRSWVLWFTADFEQPQACAR